MEDMICLCLGAMITVAAFAFLFHVACGGFINIKNKTDRAYKIEAWRYGEDFRAIKDDSCYGLYKIQALYKGDWIDAPAEYQHHVSTYNPTALRYWIEKVIKEVREDEMVFTLRPSHFWESNLPKA